MTSTILLLDKYVKACSHASDSAAARALKVQPSAVNNWRHGRAHPNAEAVERMCHAINEPLPHWLALIEAERARTPADKRVWLRLAQMAAAVALTVGLYPAHAEAPSSAHNPGHVYIMSNCRISLRRLFGTLRAWLRTLRHGKDACLALANA